MSSLTVEQFSLAGYDALAEPDDDDDEQSSFTCSTVYTVEDVSVITDDNNDDIACLDDIENEENLIADFNESIPEESFNESENVDQLITCPGFVLVIDNIDMNVRRSTRE